VSDIARDVFIPVLYLQVLMEVLGDRYYAAIMREELCVRTYEDCSDFYKDEPGNTKNKGGTSLLCCLIVISQCYESRHQLQGLEVRCGVISRWEE